jgi:hypothetical protein
MARGIPDDYWDEATAVLGRRLLCIVYGKLQDEFLNCADLLNRPPSHRSLSTPSCSCRLDRVAGDWRGAFVASAMRLPSSVACFIWEGC